uniref:Uncharacterized protein n=1 Tax=Oryza glaberrima TaxID=4538 RepID=I1QHK2_ORYGL
MAPTIFGLDEEAEDDGLGAADLTTMMMGSTSSWGNDDRTKATATGEGAAKEEGDEVQSTAATAQQGGAPGMPGTSTARRGRRQRQNGLEAPGSTGRACRRWRMTMFWTSASMAHQLTSGGEEEAAAKRMVATPGSEEVPNAGEGRLELRDGGGAAAWERGGGGLRCGERGGGQGSFL